MQDGKLEHLIPFEVGIRSPLCNLPTTLVLKGTDEGSTNQLISKKEKLKMANSMYNADLVTVAPQLKAFVTGEKEEVNLSAFQARSAARAADKGKTARKNWYGEAEVVELANGGPQTIGNQNVHVIATGDVLGNLGYRGRFYITKDLKLVKTPPPAEEKTPFVTMEQILAAANETT